MNTPEEVFDEVAKRAAKAEWIASIIFAAYAFFERAGCISDFCLQENHSNYLVFGGWNRVCWELKNGFYMSRSHCRQEFVDANKDFEGHKY